MNINVIRNDAHVVPSKGLWAVKMESERFTSGFFATKLEATALAMQYAREHRSSVVIHGANGVIQNVWSYDAHRGVDALGELA